MSSENGEDTCDFGHIFEVNGSPEVDIQGDVEKGNIDSLEDVKDAIGSDNYSLKPIMHDPVKTIKIKAKSQGKPHSTILAAASKFESGLGWDMNLTDEKVFVSPQSEFHNDYLQKKQQAEQAVKQGMQSIQQLKKQKHLLEHDIRKLRSRVEDLREGDEEVLKGDFVQLVDGAGAGGGGGADEQAMRFLRDNNFFPTIVSDFYEMRTLEDLKPPEDSDLDNPRLHNLPANEKAILKKKYTMYEKWKDLFGSEVQKKLEELKGELNRIERALKEAESQLEEPVRDMVMINQKSHEQLKEDFGQHFSFQRHSTEVKNFEFIASKGVVKKDSGLVEVDDDDKATHYKLYYMHAAHINIAGSSDPRTPQEGPTTAVISWTPALVCEHVYESIFKEKIEYMEKRFDRVMDDYTGEMRSKEGDRLSDKRGDMPVRELRKKIGDEVGESPPLELSATIRRIEDGFDKPGRIREEYDRGEEYLEAIDEILGTGFTEEDGGNGYQPQKGLKKSIREFMGMTDKYYLGSPGGIVGGMDFWLRFNYYYDLKKSLRLYTMT